MLLDFFDYELEPGPDLGRNFVSVHDPQGIVEHRQGCTQRAVPRCVVRLSSHRHPPHNNAAGRRPDQLAGRPIA